MRKGFILLTALCLAVFARGTAPAHAQVIGANCPAAQIGTSTMTADKKHIVACLIKDAGAGQEWKAFSQSGGEKGTHCGYFPIVMETYSCDGGSCANLDYGTPTPCGTTPVIKAGSSGYAGSGKTYAASSCPSDYSLKALGGPWAMNVDGGAAFVTAHAYTCVKN